MLGVRLQCRLLWQDYGALLGAAELHDGADAKRHANGVADESSTVCPALHLTVISPLLHDGRKPGRCVTLYGELRPGGPK